MTLLPAITDTPPPPGAPGCDPLAALDTEEKRHLFGVGVLAMSDDLRRTKARVVELEAENAALRRTVQRHVRRISLQHDTIMQGHRKAGTDPAPVLAAISDALGETPAAAVPVEVTHLPRGTVLGAVRVDRAGLKADPLPPPQTPGDVDRAQAPQVPDDEDCTGGAGCGCCVDLAAPPEAKTPGRAWWLRQMLTPLFGSAAGAAFIAALLFLCTGEYPSMAAALGAAIPLTGAAVLLRPRITPKRGGAR